MKTLKLLTLTVCLMLICGASMAMQPNAKSEKLTSNYTVQTYIDAVQHGRIKGLSQVIDENAKFTMQRGEKVISQSKSEILQAMKKQENVEQNCQVSHTIVQNLPNQMIIKVDMKYESFTRCNYVTLSESNNGWKISQVTTKFE